MWASLDGESMQLSEPKHIAKATGVSSVASRRVLVNMVWLVFSRTAILTIAHWQSRDLNSTSCKGDPHTKKEHVLTYTYNIWYSNFRTHLVKNTQLKMQKRKFSTSGKLWSQHAKMHSYTKVIGRGLGDRHLFILFSNDHSTINIVSWHVIVLTGRAGQECRTCFYVAQCQADGLPT